MIYSNNTYDITADISTYTRRDFKQVFDTTLSKWYMLNNLNEYEEYGIYGDSLSGTYYVGKLVVVNDEEYEWDGTQWNNLGPYVEVVSSVYRDASHTGYITFPLTSSDVASFEATFKITQNLGAAFLIGIDADDSADWRIFSYSNLLYYDCGSGRWYASGYFNNQQHMRFDGNPMRIYNYDTLTYLYTDSYIRPISNTMYFGRSDAYTPTSDYGYLYDLVFYSDNGETVIAHYIPYVQNGVAGLYDTISNTFLAPTGVLGSESEQSIPKKYPTKSAPTITNVWPSKWYHNSTYMYKLMRNDAEQIIVAYMSDDKVRKGKTSQYNVYDYLYVPSDARARWDSGLNTNTNDIEVEFEIKIPTSASSISGIYGSGWTTNGQLLYSQPTSGNAGIFKFHAGHGTDPEISVSNFLNRWIKVKLTTSAFYIDEQEVYNYGYLGQYANGNLIFFNVGTNTSWQFKESMIKYIKIKRGNNLLFDLIPAVNIENNKKGFKNLVDNTFVEVTELSGSIVMGNE